MYKVLIVEDDPMVAMINEQYVTRNKDFTVAHKCSDGKSALEYLEKNQINTNVHVYESTVATFDSPTHNAQQYQKMALEQMQKIGVNVKYDCPSCEKDC